MWPLDGIGQAQICVIQLVVVEAVGDSGDISHCGNDCQADDDDNNEKNFESKLSAAPSGFGGLLCRIGHIRLSSFPKIIGVPELT